MREGWVTPESVNFTYFWAPNAQDISFSVLCDLLILLVKINFESSFDEFFLHDYPTHPTPPQRNILHSLNSLPASKPASQSSACMRTTSLLSYVVRTSASSPSSVALR